ncbi:phosphatase PAP2 family protein [Pseudalkalibacillus hwajinpoensis]|uniref:Phosphatase PAP2 family protein n=1 Tax=Guptibacillus hwajinpoensis TaxID=208199 RepID=A0A4U1MCF8_9BACL|nr:phosphatase PAP2 family protein [Pseudalkalibacillus hwajinpoensis]TKD68012.1 phosphatase PAP2 family protein [Pseudalkalibacillus hwajinpoensis]
MSKVVGWLHEQECTVFRFVNLRCHSRFLTSFFSWITHVGGARMTVIGTLLLCMFLPSPSRLWAIQSACALAISHFPVHLIKKHYPRHRPYLSIPETKMLVHPLKDHSFPSGHTTAVFSVLTPFILHIPTLFTPLIALASLVGLSRIYLGHHYPSDVLVGVLLGGGCGVLVSILFS